MTGDLIQKKSSGGVLWKGVLKNSTKFTGKHLRQGLFFIKVAFLRPAILLRKGLWNRCFPVNFVNFLRTPISMEHLWWLLLLIASQHCIIASSKIYYLDKRRKLNIHKTFRRRPRVILSILCTFNLCSVSME